MRHEYDVEAPSIRRDTSWMRRVSEWILRAYDAMRRGCDVDTTRIGRVYDVARSGYDVDATWMRRVYNMIRC